MSGGLRYIMRRMVAKIESTIWDRVLEPSWSELTPQMAEGILGLRFGESDLARMNELGELARKGTLSGEQEIELDTYNRVGRTVAILQSKARQALHKTRIRNER